MKVFMILCLVLLVGGCTTFTSVRDDGSAVPSFGYQCQTFGSGRGIDVDFVDLPFEVREGQPLFLNLKFANYFGTPTYATLLITPSVPVKGFETYKGSVTIDEADVDGGRWYGPGCVLRYLHSSCRRAIPRSPAGTCTPRPQTRQHHGSKRRYAEDTRLRPGASVAAG